MLNTFTYNPRGADVIVINRIDPKSTASATVQIPKSGSIRSLRMNSANRKMPITTITKASSVRNIQRQKTNVDRMRLLGAEVRPVTSGSSTLKDAMNEALRFWVAKAETHGDITRARAGSPDPRLRKHRRSEQDSDFRV